MIELEAQEGMDGAVEHFVDSLRKIRAGKASPEMLNGVMVEAYGAMSPLNTLANVSSTDARTLTIQPFDKSVLQNIERGIVNSNLGFNPQNDGSLIRIAIPPLTQERREQLVKMAKAEMETAKVSVRNTRKDANEEIKKLVKDGLSEDIGKDAESSIQELTNATIKKIEDLYAQKEVDIMTV